MNEASNGLYVSRPSVICRTTGPPALSALSFSSSGSSTSYGKIGVKSMAGGGGAGAFGGGLLVVR